MGFNIKINGDEMNLVKKINLLKLVVEIKLRLLFRIDLIVDYVVLKCGKLFIFWLVLVMLV